MSLSHIDLTDPDNFLDGTPHHWLTQIRNEDPVHWHEGSTGAAFWCITKWEDLRHVSRNPTLFSSERRGTNMSRRIRSVTVQWQIVRGRSAVLELLVQ